MTVTTACLPVKSTSGSGAPRTKRRGIWAEALDGEQRDQLRRDAADAGVAITSLSSDWVWGFSEYHPTLDSWERGGELLKQDMALTADLGARACLIHFARARATWEQAKRYCAETAEAAAQRGVVAAQPARVADTSAPWRAPFSPSGQPGGLKRSPRSS